MPAMPDALNKRGGRMHLDALQYNLTKTFCIDRPCVCLEGDVWAYIFGPQRRV